MKNASARKKRAEAHTGMKAKALSCAILFAKDCAFFVRVKQGIQTFACREVCFRTKTWKAAVRNVLHTAAFFSGAED